MDYKKILEGVVDIINTAEKSDIGFANICTYIGKNCPELKESEDERISKALIHLITEQDGYLTAVNGISTKDILAWLEKQSEPVEINPTEFDTRLQTLIGKFDSLPKEELIGSLSFWLNVVQNNGTYKPAKKQGEQKPAEWSEEDEKAINDIMWIIEAYRKNGFNETHIQIADSSENWLKHLKERVFTQPKQEWSEKDEYILNNIYDFVAENLLNRNKGVCADECLKWLKSLKPQNHWKPSDEQMKALNYVVNLMASSSSPTQNDYYYNVFKDLRKQLKKLREE